MWCFIWDIRELKESVSKSYLDQLSELCRSLEAKEKELAGLNRISAEQKHGIEDLNERLSASVQSGDEANEIINRHKKAKVHFLVKVHLGSCGKGGNAYLAEAEEEIKRISDAALRREKEQQDVINKLQEAEKDICSLVETLRSKLFANWRLKFERSSVLLPAIEKYTCFLLPALRIYYLNCYLWLVDLST
ncbi:unnamed protein product [Fraxinus pennsylvanica]|uniref:Uncharacterized protein n=1 Tax=Fraxinus pennsylvanica TaxID=56036 RepID=A0AAD1ZKN3_9LAMI|nr:unnamed protein product [Fraxinus pennsylvanica]